MNLLTTILIAANAAALAWLWWRHLALRLGLGRHDKPADDEDKKA